MDKTNSENRNIRMPEGDRLDPNLSVLADSMQFLSLGVPAISQPKKFNVNAWSTPLKSIENQLRQRKIVNENDKFGRIDRAAAAAAVDDDCNDGHSLSNLSDLFPAQNAFDRTYDLIEYYSVRSPPALSNCTPVVDAAGGSLHGVGASHLSDETTVANLEGCATSDSGCNSSSPTRHSPRAENWAHVSGVPVGGLLGRSTPTASPQPVGSSSSSVTHKRDDDTMSSWPRNHHRRSSNDDSCDFIKLSTDDQRVEDIEDEEVDDDVSRYDSATSDDNRFSSAASHVGGSSPISPAPSNLKQLDSVANVVEAASSECDGDEWPRALGKEDDNDDVCENLVRSLSTCSPSCRCSSTPPPASCALSFDAVRSPRETVQSTGTFAVAAVAQPSSLEQPSVKDRPMNYQTAVLAAETSSNALIASVVQAAKSDARRARHSNCDPSAVLSASFSRFVEPRDLTADTHSTPPPSKCADNDHSFVALSSHLNHSPYTPTTSFAAEYDSDQAVPPEKTIDVSTSAEKSQSRNDNRPSTCFSTPPFNSYDHTRFNIMSERTEVGSRSDGPPTAIDAVSLSHERIISLRQSEKLDCASETPTKLVDRGENRPSDKLARVCDSMNRLVSLCTPMNDLRTRSRTSIEPFRCENLGNEKRKIVFDFPTSLLDVSIGMLENMTALMVPLETTNGAATRLNEQNVASDLISVAGTPKIIHTQSDQPSYLSRSNASNIDERMLEESINLKVELEEYKRKYKVLQEEYESVLKTALALRANETTLKKALQEYEDETRKACNKYHILKEYADTLIVSLNKSLDQYEEKLRLKNEELEKLKGSL